MTNESYVERLKEKIFEVEQSRKDSNTENRIVLVHLDANLFLKMAYLFVGMHG